MPSIVQDPAAAVRRYLIVFCCLALATAVSLALQRAVGRNPLTTLLYLLAILMSAWWGGYGPGVLAGLISTCFVPYLFNSQFTLAKVNVSVFVLVVLVSLLICRIAATRAKTEATLREINAALDERVRQRTLELQQTNTALLESEARLRLALHAGKMGAWECNLDEHTVAWSPELEALHGLLPGKFGGTFADFQRDIHSDHKVGVVSAIEAAWRERRDYQAEYQIVRPDDTLVWVEARGQVVRDKDGHMERMVGICMDITQRKNAELELQHQTEQLAESNADLQQFAYIASHDLQEPLRTITTYTKWMAKKYNAQLDADADEFIGYILAATRRMEDLIRDLLAYSRVIHSEQQPHDPVPAQEIVDTAMRDLHPAIVESGAIVTIGRLPALPCNKGQLVQVFQNLLSNALKYRGEDKPCITITAERDGTDWVFSVQDNGIGIHPDYHERIFQPFKRLHGSEYPGTGVGLAICKRIIERHGGRIWVESALDIGTTFRFTIPTSEAAVEQTFASNDVLV